MSLNPLKKRKLSDTKFNEVFNKKTKTSSHSTMDSNRISYPAPRNAIDNRIEHNTENDSQMEEVQSPSDLRSPHAKFSDEDRGLDSDSPSNQNQFITQWETYPYLQSVRLPIQPGSICDFTIDWGDGTPLQHIDSENPEIDVANISHSYKEVGIHTIVIDGVLHGFTFYLHNYSLKRKRSIKRIMNWSSNLILADNGSQFMDCINLRITALNTPNLVMNRNLSRCFKNVTHLMINSIRNWNVSTVQNVSQMFENCSMFNGDLSCWKLGNVTNATAMLRGCEIFNSNLSNWDTKSLEHISYMFYGCQSFSCEGLTLWNINRIRNATLVLKGVANQVDLDSLRQSWLQARQNGTQDQALNKLYDLGVYHNEL